jgi:transposase
LSSSQALALCDNRAVTSTPENLPDEIAALQAALAAERTARQEAEARASGAEAMAAHLKLLIAKLRREQCGQSSERGRKLLDQLELQLEEAAAAAAEDELAAAPPTGTAVGPFTRRQPVRAPFPAHLPRERVVIPGPTACPCCDGKLAKLGETMTETLEVVPRQRKLIQTVREKITQPPAPFHVIPRGHVGPSLLAMILYAKYGEHQPLNRQSEAYAREGVDLDVSTLADHVGAGAAVLSPLTELIRRHVFAAERVHGDDTTVPVLAKGKTVTGRLWTPAFARAGSMCATTGRLPGPARRRRCSSPRAIVPASILLGTWPAMPASCSRCLYRVRRALRRQTQTRPDHRSGVLEPRPATLLRAGRSTKGAAGDRGGPAHRRYLRHRAQDQRTADR